MTDDFSRFQEQVNTRAIELASSANALISQHLVECRDRYVALDQKLDKKLGDMNALFIKAAWGVVGLLLSIIGFLVTKFGVPGIH